MIDPWHNYRQLAALLSPYETQNIVIDNWQQVIAIANDHWVTPALHGAIQTAPHAVIDYVEGMKTLNHQRNHAHFEAIAEIVDAMYALRIEPIWLKGAASLLTDLYEVPDDRMVGDLDVLFSAHHVNKAKLCLEQLGYVYFPGKEKQKSSHHLPRVYHPVSGVTIELHVNVIPKVSPQVLPVANAIANKKQHNWNGRTIFTLSNSHRIIHNIVHLQRDATRHSLRQLREFARMKMKFGQTIDWHEIAETFRRANFIEGYIDHLALSRHVFGTATHFSQHDAKLANQRLKYNFKNSFPEILPRTLARRMLHIALPYTTVIAYDPWRVLQIFSPAKWRKNIPSISKKLMVSSQSGAQS